MLTGLSSVWPWNPWALAVLLLLCLLYVVGLWRVHVRHPQEAVVKPYHILSFFAAILIAALLLLTPVDTIARTQLFMVHIAQAVLLTTACSPLIFFGCPDELLHPLIELPIIRSIVRALTKPLTASLIFNLTFLLWHTPRLFDAASVNEQLYHIQMLMIFLTSLLNWWPLIGSVQELRYMNYPVQMLYAFFDGQPVDIFAFVLVFSGTTIYSHYTAPPQWALLPFSDQATGGAILLIPGIVDLVVMTPLFFRWLGQIEQKTRSEDLTRQAELEEEEWEEDEADEEEAEDLEGIAHFSNGESRNASGS